MTSSAQILPETEAVPPSLREPAPISAECGYGFWLFLLSDILNADEEIEISVKEVGYYPQVKEFA